MKKTLIIITIAIILIFNNSCIKEDLEFEGLWSGTYSGNEDNGTWQASISSSGSVNGTFTSSMSSIDFNLIGNVDSNGNLESTFGNSVITGELTGTLSEDIATGIWINQTQNINGTWEGSKD